MNELHKCTHKYTFACLIVLLLLADTDCSGGSAANSSILQTPRDQVRLSPACCQPLQLVLFRALVFFYDSPHSLAINLPSVLSTLSQLPYHSSSPLCLHFVCLSVCHTHTCTHLFSLCGSLTVSATPSSPCLTVFFRSQRHTKRLTDTYKVTLLQLSPLPSLSKH